MIKTTLSSFFNYRMILQQRTPPGGELQCGKRIVLLLKVYQEEEFIANSIRHIKQILDLDPNLSAVIVGTEREVGANGFNPTLEIARDLCQGDGRIEVIEASGHSPSPRANQLNFALSRIGFPEEKTWVLHLDVDTRFSTEGIFEMIGLVNSEENIIQQSSIFLGNFSDLDYWQRGHAIFQTRWTFLHEILRLRLAQINSFVLTHIVGHGCCIRLSKLREYGGWPEALDTEDIHLGFIFCSSGERVACTNAIENSSTPRRFADGFAQECAWSFGALNYFRYWNYSPRTSSLRTVAMTIQGVVLWMNWFTMSWVLLVTIVLSLLSYSFATWLLLMVVADYVAIQMFLFMRGYTRPSKIIFDFPSYMAECFRRSLSANYMLIRLIFGRDQAPHKTVT
jgi:hypothetical protein